MKAIKLESEMTLNKKLFTDLDESRVSFSNQSSFLEAGDCVVYHMSRDQRVQGNFALLRALEYARSYEKRLIVVFSLHRSTTRSKQAYQFMLEGLRLLKRDLEKLGIPFLLLDSEQNDLLTSLKALNPCAVVTDFSPLSGPLKLQNRLSKELNCRYEVVDAHNIVPCTRLSDKEEFAAHTIRRKLHKSILSYIYEPEAITAVDDVEFTNDFFEKHQDFIIPDWVEQLHDTKQDYVFAPGETVARKALEDFITKRLNNYSTDRNNALVDGQSELSPYLHFGHISALQVVLLVMDSASVKAPELHICSSFKLPKEEMFSSVRTASRAAFIEELVVRKELADNYCYYNQNYKSLAGAKPWAVKTLEEHRQDAREFVYDLDVFEAGETHDELWNACQLQMVRTGKMHGYLRMYWAKKILEWTQTPEEAIKFAIILNDRYSLDGGDPNGYTGVMWSIAGVHDRPWQERSVFGKIRFMNETGISRRFKVKDFVESQAQSLF